MFATKVSVFESQLLQRWSFKRQRYVRVRKRRGCSETKYAVFQPQLWSNVICVAAGQVKNIFLQPKKRNGKILQKTPKKWKKRKKKKKGGFTVVKHNSRGESTNETKEASQGQIRISYSNKKYIHTEI